MAPKNGYRRESHIRAVKAASRARNTARSVLIEMCAKSSFDGPHVTITTPQICEAILAGKDGADYERPEQMPDGKRWEPPGRRAVKDALRMLRKEGTIKYLRNKQGGRGYAVTWELCIPRGGRSTAPSSSKTSEPAMPANIWDEISVRYRAAEPLSWDAWISHLSFVSAESGLLRISAPTIFAANYCRTHLADALLSIAAELDPEIRRVEIEA